MNRKIKATVISGTILVSGVLGAVGLVGEVSKADDLAKQQFGIYLRDKEKCRISKLILI